MGAAVASLATATSNPCSISSHICDSTHMLASIPPRMTLGDPPLAQLQDEIVGLRAQHPVRRYDDGLAIVDIGLEAYQPICARVLEAVEVQDSPTAEEACGGLVRLERPVELPAGIGRIEIVRRNEHLESLLLRRRKDSLHVLDGVVLRQALPHQGPRESRLAQYLVLRI